MLRWKKTKGFGTPKVADRRQEAEDARAEGRHADAARAYEAVIAVRPNDGGLHVQCGHMHKESGNLAKAEELYKKALALMPNDADLHNQLGHFYKVAGSLDRALQHYLRASELDPAWREPQEEADVLRFRYPSLATAVAARPAVGRSGKPIVSIEFVGKR